MAIIAAGTDHGRQGNATSQAAMELTEALQMATQTMAAELEKSVQTSRMLEESSTVLEKTGKEYGYLSSALVSSKRVLKRLSQRDWTDRILISFGVIVFCTVVLYIVQKRLLRYGLSWWGWWSWLLGYGSDTVQ
jgi:protein transport protein SEC20